MHRRCLNFVLVVLLFGLAACHHKKNQNPISEIDTKQPDKVMFDRAMDAMKHNKFDDARMLLQTLINTYPDSEFLARAKLGIGDTWYADGSTASLTQAEAEYKDFIAFFPNMPEAAEAQLKISGIEYRQMEKPDRDYAHAVRAEEEYRAVLQQYPDSKLVPEAKERLREVQEVLADREFRIGRFYYLRGAWAAAIARLQSLVDAYPLYSGASEALFMVADAYEKQITFSRNNNQMSAEARARLIKEFSDRAAEAYARLITRYPIMPRAQDARKRLEAMQRPVPKATAEAIAQNKAEEESRRHSSAWKQPLQNFRKRPDFSLAARVGEPTLVSPKSASAPAIVREANDIYAGKPAGTDTHSVSVETVNPNAPPANQPTPRSTSGTDAPPAAKDTSSTGPAPEPPQVNQAASSSREAGASSSGSTGNTASDQSGDTPQSSSKQKEKKGFRKIMPF